MAAENARIVLSRSPADRLSAEDFTLETGPVESPGPGEVLVRNVLLSIDPAARAWMQGRTYRDQVRPGDLMPGFTLAEVVGSRDERLPVGTIVLGDGGWQEYAVRPGAELRPIRVRGPLTHHLSTLGITGLTAWVGLHRVGHPTPGETLVVSAAAGATGNVVGQLARAAGLRVVGIAGSAEKLAWLTGELGFDAAVSHRSPTFREELRAACPDGVDLYFDNVGGPLLDPMITAMNLHGRIVCCGAISQYDTTAPGPGPRLVPGLLITKRLRMEGFLVTEHDDVWEDAVDEMAGLIADGRLRVVEQVDEGLAAAPDALVGLLAGHNVGKQLVRIGPDPA
jgi:hypothetical protein